MQQLRQTAGCSLAAITLAGLPILSCQQESKLTPPNIILILADDMGFGDAEVLNPESRIATPNLDRLATEGLIFTDAHTPSGVCTPKRAVLHPVAGKNQDRGGMRNHHRFNGHLPNAR